ncbi:MAG: sulfatase-like hydrolase/transferase, partial [Verrucomicrobiae bacterium]|nr:sulfatase-like hydrolase/transferase [Verrucomicrobiae bacterium]
MRYKSLPPRMRMLVLLFLALGALYAKAAERPNILFFFTDDESWLERSAYGWSALPTPAFDRVARQGVLFTNAFTSAPSCAPSRASILTGRNFWELKQGAFIQAYLPSEFPIFTKLLKESGYHVGNTAKVWGPGVVNEDSHDVFSGTAYNSARVSHPTPEMSPYDYAANFETFLQDRKPEQPFFFWAGINEPHGPWGKENYFLLEKECGMTLDQIPLPPYLEDNEANRIARANILYEIVYADRQLGRMLQHLESVGE